MRWPRPRHWKTDPLEGCRQLQDQGYPSLIFFSCLSLNLSTSSKISHTIRSAPQFRQSEASHSIRDLYRPSATSRALRAVHHRTIVGISAIGCSLVTFFGIKKKSVLQACCGHLPRCSTFFRNATSSPLDKSSGTLG